MSGAGPKPKLWRRRRSFGAALARHRESFAIQSDGMTPSADKLSQAFATNFGGGWPAIKDWRCPTARLTRSSSLARTLI